MVDVTHLASRRTRRSCQSSYRSAAIREARDLADLPRWQMAQNAWRSASVRKEGQPRADPRTLCFGGSVRACEADSAPGRVARSRRQISKEGSARSAGIRAPVVFGLRNRVRSIWMKDVIGPSLDETGGPRTTFGAVKSALNRAGGRLEGRGPPPAPTRQTRACPARRMNPRTLS
jgi:hypothetical protein